MITININGTYLGNRWSTSVPYSGLDSRLQTGFLRWLRSPVCLSVLHLCSPIFSLFQPSAFLDCSLSMLGPQLLSLPKNPLKPFQAAQY